jgi:hypothetical protein
MAALALTVVALSGAKAQDKAASLPDWVNHIQPFADLRFRYDETDNQDTDERVRERLRARFGADVEVNDSFNMIFELATSETQPNGQGDPISNNQTMTNSFSGKPVWLYLGYFDYHPKQIQGLHIDGGKMNNPFYIPATNQLIWDRDLTPEGVALRYSHAFGAFEPFLNIGNFWITERYTSSGDQDTSDKWTELTGFQGGTKVNLADNKVYLKAGVGNFYYSRTKGWSVIGPSTSFAGNSSVTKDIDGKATSVYDNTYNLMEYNGEVGGKIGSVPWIIYGDYVINNGITTKDSGVFVKENPKDNIGYIAGVSIGSYDKPLGLAVRYYYRYLQKDAVIGAFCDSDDSGGGTDNHGNTVGLDLGLYKNVWASLTYYMDVTKISEDNPSDDRGRNYHRLFVDLNVKF